MVVIEESAEAYAVRGAELEIAFRLVHDRWQHFISVRHEGRYLPLLTSAEGQPDDEQLLSPALQDLRLETLSDDVFEFQLLGQAGKGVYSAAVRFDGAAQSIDFDLCARRRSAESPLCTASRYTLAGSVEARVRQQSKILLLEVPHASSRIKLSPVPIPGQPTTCCRLDAEGPVMRVLVGCFESIPLSPEKQAVSVRWRYRVAGVQALAWAV
jgi:hypothetical protein